MSLISTCDLKAELAIARRQYAELIAEKTKVDNHLMEMTRQLVDCMGQMAEIRSTNGRLEERSRHWQRQARLWHRKHMGLQNMVVGVLRGRGRAAVPDGADLPDDSEPPETLAESTARWS
eukprot:TRINITY_DN258_c0_g2_i1.p1 TRINITY_DN258_c0_g2~~TRINITY_DN258_c0_g2_i1.p1  ORF type:complete len:129 (+),score=3.46 TRINITY_DN258_c0_g2_i1:28-387(+)